MQHKWSTSSTLKRIALAVAVAAGGLAVSAPAFACDGWHKRHRHHHHHPRGYVYYGAPVYVPPPVYYYPRQVYYPPVYAAPVYAPPPSVNFGFGFR
jgi:hypothetical protein